MLLRAATIALLLATPALAQTEYKLDESGNWKAAAPAPTSDSRDADSVVRARSLLIDGDAAHAESLLDTWIDKHDLTQDPLLPEAYLLRADAKVAQGDEYQALYDYEHICREFPGSEPFVTAVSRECDIAIKYIHGYKRKWLGMRITAADDVGEELLVRVQERMPGSRLAERAALELADYYYRDRDLKMAADMYEIFVRNFPTSEHVEYARERRIYSTIARFQGPDYDASTLTDARVLIEELENVNPDAARKAGLSDAMMSRLDESEGAHILRKANWYIQRGDLVSARYVLRRLVKVQPRTVAGRQALKMLEQRAWSVAEPEREPGYGVGAVENGAPESAKEGVQGPHAPKPPGAPSAPTGPLAPDQNPPPAPPAPPAPSAPSAPTAPTGPTEKQP